MFIIRIFLFYLKYKFHKLEELIQAGDFNKPLEVFQGETMYKLIFHFFFLMVQSLGSIAE